MGLINKIGLGTVQFGLNYGISNKVGKTPKHEVTNILKKAKTLNINLLDTAISYGNAEEVIGGFDLENFQIVSKFMPSKNNKSISSQIEESLAKLKLSKIYGYLSHRPMSLVENPNDWNELLLLKEKNKVKKIGFSLNTTDELKALIQNGFEPDIIQVPYNYFDNRFKNLIVQLKENGCEVHTRSTFLQGLFFIQPSKLSRFFYEVKPIIKKLQNETKNLSRSLLKYVLEKDFIDRVIVGIESSKQLNENFIDIEYAEDLKEFEGSIKNEILSPYLWEK